MKKDEIKDILYTSKGLIVSKLLDYVRQHGTDVTDYERNAFGFDDEKYDHQKDYEWTIGDYNKRWGY